MVQNISRSAGRSLLLSAIVMLPAAACRQSQPEPQPAANQQVAEPAPQPPDEPFLPPIPVPPADRETLLIATLRAASAAAAGLDDRAEQESLAGKRFVLRERFGCSGPSAEGPRRWTFDESTGALRVHFEPTLHPARQAQPAPDEGADGDEGAATEQVAAYSVEHPWLLTATCLAQGASAPPGGGGKVAFVQPFTKEDSRAVRPPETHKAVKRIAPEEVPARGLEFVLSGRLEEGPDGRVIHCATCTPGTRPDCIVHMSIDGARIEEPERGLVVAEWGDS